MQQTLVDVSYRHINAHSFVSSNACQRIDTERSARPFSMQAIPDGVHDAYSFFG
jgi:hypothetical protein